jgi:hypothetical protein
MSARQSHIVNGLFFNFYDTKSFVLDTGIDIYMDRYILIDIKGLSSGENFSNAMFAVICVNHSSGFSLKKSGQSYITVRAFILDDRVHLFVNVVDTYGNMYLRLLYKEGVPSFYPATEIPAGATKIIDVS